MDLPNPGLSPGLLHWRQILYQLSHEQSLAWTQVLASSSALGKDILNAYLRWWHQIRKSSPPRIRCAHVTLQTFILFIYLLYYITQLGPFTCLRPSSVTHLSLIPNNYLDEITDLMFCKVH